MKLKIKSVSQVKGVVKAPPSKSYTHRAVILASLSKGTSILKDPLSSEDTIASRETCEKFGANINSYDNYWEVEGTAGNLQIESDEAIDLKNSGTTLRIMASIAALANNKIIFTGDDSLKTRPMKPLLDSLKDLGVEIKSINNNDKVPIEISPGFKGGVSEIIGNISSQYISSMLISGPLTKLGIEVKIKGKLSSKPYIDMTRDIMSKFSVKSTCESLTKHKECKNDSKKCISHIFRVEPQKYIATDYVIEGDYSSASYLLGAVAIYGGEITVKNLFKDSKQGDKLIIDVLKCMGVKITVKYDSVTLKSDGILKGVNINLQEAPDLLPTIAVLGALANGETNIYGVEHGRFKETDRIATSCEELAKLGVNIQENPDGLKIIGGVTSGTVTSHKDHRLAMALSLIGLKHDVVVEDGEVFDISFPNFIEAMGEIGINFQLFSY
ncbi:MAG: 3-phosphoshikimate 1-carboxyvinyltransferase [Methanobacteriaceae archaeon]|jgi:3-phosphoshikimate 1-carboxyvinyltransferase|nr:3-phosphoshikimate 1-carboxyvinyltransferase [Candidatus Methanorudis spinitermitis]